MRKRFAIIVVLVSGVAGTAARADDTSSPKNWGQWRGPIGAGLAPGASPPVEWSDTKNVKWKRELPGEGLSTPIVWGDRVYIQAAIPVEGQSDAKAADAAAEEADSGEEDRDGGRRGRGRDGRRGRGGPPAAPSKPYRFVVLAFDRATGEPVWEKPVCELIPHEGSHDDGSVAPASPVTDGERLYAYFGSRGLYCMTMDGEVVWEKDLGDMQTRNGFGEGASPTLHGDTLIINWDHEGDSFIVALDKKSGDEKWRTPRDERTTWVTPVVITDGGSKQVVVTGSNKIRSYKLADGKLVWECSGLGSNCVPTPIDRDGMLYVMSGHREPAAMAIRYGGATGDISASDRIVWRTDKGTPYVPSPVLVGDSLYMLQKNSEILSCVDAQTGEPRYEQQRLSDVSGVYSSLVAANDRIYVVGRNGVTYVLKHGPSFEVLATNRLDDSFSASPAIVGDALFLRGQKNLYCIAAE